MSCGGDESKEKTETKADTTAAAPAEPAADPEIAKGLDLVAKSDCFTCHKLTETSIGPSYKAVAEKYKTLNQATIDSIAAQIKKGGSGKWGTVPMTPHPTIPKEDAEVMAHYIMSIK